MHNPTIPEPTMAILRGMADLYRSPRRPAGFRAHWFACAWRVSARRRFRAAGPGTRLAAIEPGQVRSARHEWYRPTPVAGPRRSSTVGRRIVASAAHTARDRPAKR